MSDARLFTHDAPRCYQMMKNYSSSYQMRTQMIANAEMLMQKDREDSFLRAMCEPCFAFTEDGTMLPESSKVVCNKQYYTISNNNAVGLGQGRDFGNKPQPLTGQEVAFYPIEGMESDVYDKHASYGTFQKKSESAKQVSTEILPLSRYMLSIKAPVNPNGATAMRQMLRPDAPSFVPNAPSTLRPDAPMFVPRSTMVKASRSGGTAAKSKSSVSMKFNFWDKTAQSITDQKLAMYKKRHANVAQAPIIIAFKNDVSIGNLQENGFEWNQLDKLGTTSISNIRSFLEGTFEPDNEDVKNAAEMLMLGGYKPDVSSLKAFVESRSQDVVEAIICRWLKPSELRIMFKNTPEHTIYKHVIEFDVIAKKEDKKHDIVAGFITKQGKFFKKLTETHDAVYIFYKRPYGDRKNHSIHVYTFARNKGETIVNAITSRMGKNLPLVGSIRFEPMDMPVALRDIGINMEAVQNDERYTTGVIQGRKLQKKWDIVLNLSIDEDVDEIIVEYLAASPPDYRQSFSGSGLPHSSIFQAYSSTPNTGVVHVENGNLALRLLNPNAYYDEKMMRVDPHVLLRFRSNGLLRTVDIKLGPSVPSRDIMTTRNARVLSSMRARAQSSPKNNSS
eukprot:gene19606-26289_t